MTASGRSCSCRVSSHEKGCRLHRALRRRTLRARRVAAAGARGPGRPAGHRAPDAEPNRPERRLGSRAVRRQLRELPRHRRAGRRDAARWAREAFSAPGPPLRGVGALAADFYLRTGYMPLANPHDQPSASACSSPTRRSVRWSPTSPRSGTGPAIPTPRPGPARRPWPAGLSCSPSTAPGATRRWRGAASSRGARVPPLQNVSATQIAEAVRIGPYLMPRFPTSQISDAQLERDHRLRPQHQRSRRPWRLGDRQHRAGVRKGWSRGDRRGGPGRHVHDPRREVRCVRIGRWLAGLAALVAGRRLRRALDRRRRPATGGSSRPGRPDRQRREHRARPAGRGQPPGDRVHRRLRRRTPRRASPTQLPGR